MELLEEDLTCPICCCLFEDPRVLPCSHSFCRKCLEGILDGNRSLVWRPPIKCPTCRKESTHDGIASLQVNYPLRDIAEKYSKIRSLPRMAPCRAHGGQPLNIFCATDLKLICGFCATAAEHRGHELCGLEEAYKREKATAEELLRQGGESWRGTEALSRLEALEGAKKEALQAVKRDAERADEYFASLMRVLEHKRSEVLADFETVKLALMQTFDPEIERLRMALQERQRALSIADSLQALNEPLTFLQRMQDLRETLRGVSETPLPTLKDVDVSKLVPTFDEAAWDRMRFGDIESVHSPHASSFGGWQVPVPRALWLGCAWLLCLCLLAFGILPAERFATGLTDMLGTLGTISLGELQSWLGVAWKQAETVCTLFIELCRNYVRELQDATSDFIS